MPGLRELSEGTVPTQGGAAIAAQRITTYARNPDDSHVTQCRCRSDTTCHHDLRPAGIAVDGDRLGARPAAPRVRPRTGPRTVEGRPAPPRRDLAEQRATQRARH